METGIYSITNTITNKVYVGSAVKIESRWKEHLNDLRKNKHHSIKLQRAFNKYGESTFIFNVIMLCDKNELIINEQKFIDSLESYKKGYNSCPIAGSRLGHKQSQETKDKIRNKLKGRTSPKKGTITSDETKLKLSKAHMDKKLSDTHVENIRQSKMGDKNPFYGKKVKEEHKTYKKINQYTKDMEFIKEWNSLTKCAKALNTRVVSISAVLTKARKNHLGFIFTYA
jgi:group I intron endonuclease